MGLLVDGVWQDEDPRRSDERGGFQRPDSSFRSWVSADGSSDFPAEPGRYHLYVNRGCPWAHRALLYRAVKGLDGVVSLSATAPAAGPSGWRFAPGPGCIADPIHGAEHLHQVYAAAQPDYTGRVTVPVLWDRKTGTIVNNESSEIIRMFNSAFDTWGDAKLDFYPGDLASEIDALNERIYRDVNNGVYRCGFAGTQEAYEAAFERLFALLDELEERLGRRRYLFGDRLTESDWRLFCTLVRFDTAYYPVFRCNLRRIVDYENLWGYTRDLYQFPGVADTVSLSHIKRIYWSNVRGRSPSPLIPMGPELDFGAPHGRARP